MCSAGSPSSRTFRPVRFARSRVLAAWPGYEAKTPIVTAGDPGEAFYVILSGRAKIQRGRGRAVAEIGPGSYFGEMALIDGARRSATIVAETETTCLMLTRKRFAKVLRGEPSVALALFGTLAARVRELEASPAD